MPEVRELGERLGAQFENLTGDENAYFALLVRLWRAGDSFIIVEQDMLPAASLLEEMWACPQDWCAGFEAQLILDPPLGEVQSWSLGCMKFGSELLRSVPWAMEVAGPCSWWSLDLHLYGAMGRGDPSKPGGVPHLHGPPMRHLHAG